MHSYILRHTNHIPGTKVGIKRVKPQQEVFSLYLTLLLFKCWQHCKGKRIFAAFIGKVHFIVAICTKTHLPQLMPERDIAQMSSMLLHVCKYIYIYIYIRIYIYIYLFIYFYTFSSIQYNFHTGNTIKLYLLPDYNKPSEAIAFQGLAISASSEK
jgi:hypothetical protein